MSFAAKLGSKLVIMISGRVSLLILGLVVTAILTRTLGPAGFGQYRAAVAYLGLIVVLADMGLASIFMREISRVGADQQRIVGNALALRLAISSAMLLIAVGLAFLLPFDHSARLGILGGALGFLAYSLHLLLFGLFQQRLRQQGAVLAELSGGIVLVLVVVVFAAMEADPAWFVVALGLSYVLTLFVSLFFARRLLKLRLRFELPQWRKLAQAALPLAGTGILGVLYIRADTILLALMQSPEAVGLYGVPIKIFDSLMGITLLFIGLFAPLFAQSASLDNDKFQQILTQGVGILFMGSMLLLLVINSLAGEIILILAGPAFIAAKAILQLLTVLFVLHSTTLLFREAAVALNLQKRLLQGYFIGAVIAFIAYFALIPAYAGIGAATALLAGESFVLIWAISVVRHDVNLRGLLRVPAITIVAGAFIYLGFLHQGEAIAWPLRLVGASIAYIVILFAMGALSWVQVSGLIKSMMSSDKISYDADD
jgi:O-antigen/teichoic acid export membrane protein